MGRADPVTMVERSGAKPQSCYGLADRLADDPPKLDGPRIEPVVFLRYR